MCFNGIEGKKLADEVVREKRERKKKDKKRKRALQQLEHSGGSGREKGKEGKKRKEKRRVCVWRRKNEGEKKREGNMHEKKEVKK